MAPSPPTAPTQADLYRVGRSWLPRVLFAKPGVREAVNQAAAIWARLGQRVDELYQQGLIQLSTGPYLRQHLRDVGSALQGSETTAAARLRARSIAEAVSPVALLAAANDLLAAAALGLGKAALIELRTDKAWVALDFAGKAAAYCDRGYRAGPDRHPSYTIVVLPYQTPDWLRDSIRAALTKKRAAGFPLMIEVRQVP